MPLATSRGRSARLTRLSRSSPPRRAARPRPTPLPLAPEQVRATLDRWSPPGGWLIAAVILFTLATATGVAFPFSPAGLLLQAVVGMAGGPLVPAWAGWLSWHLIRNTPWPSGWRLAALATLSLTWLVSLSLHAPQGGGYIGETLLMLLDAGFGRSAGLAVVSLAAAASLVNLIGFERILGWLSPLARVELRYPTIHVPHPSAPKRLRRALGAEAPTPAAESSDGPVILGPRGLADEPLPHPAAKEPVPLKRVDRAPRHSERETPWKRPDIGLLQPAANGASFSPAELKARAKIIEETLLTFNVQARVVEVQQGPAITQFGVDPAPGVAVNKIVQRQNDLALRLGAPTLRVLAPVPGRPMVGIEVPNTSVATVKLGDLTGSSQFGRARLPIGVGMDVAGKPVVADLTRMPHVLVAGATGSGKSVCINSLITSLLVSRSPDEVQLILIDPKQVELSQYRGLPHLRLPVVTDMEKVVAALRWTVLEMERRYGMFAEVGARNIVAFNDRFPTERLAYLVVVIDELADMMMTAAEDVERLICRLAQLGRAAGVHLVVATQRPSVDVLTGLIKANLPTRIAFAVSSQIDSRVILDRIGAEKLLGRGDGLYQAGDEMNPRRVQGAYVSDEEIDAICSVWREQGEAQHTAADEAELEKLARQEDPEERLLAQARELLDEHDGDVSPSFLARKLKIGVQKANRIHQALVADETAAQSTTPDP